MNGPQHYHEAERLLGGDMQDIAAAQVHATLALAAATAENVQAVRANRELSGLGAAWARATQ